MKSVGQHNKAKWHVAWLLSAVSIMVAGCQGDEDSASAATSDTLSLGAVVELPEGNTPEAMASESDANYANNVYGLITGSTLESWRVNWAANKPSGVNGKLVILQTGSGETGAEFIAPATDVYTYAVGSTEWVETRSNGVVETVSMVPSGQVMDNFLAKYNIDVLNDMVVCAQGTAGAFPAMRAGRCWYMFRYWGMPQGRLAMLNGGNQWNAANEGLTMSATGSTAPYTGTATVKDLPQMNFALQATVEDLINTVPSSDTNELSDGVFIWDARGNNLPVSLTSSGADEYSPDDDADFRNSGATQGHPNGALLLSYINLLDTANGYTYKSKAELQSYLDGNTDTGGNGFVDATLQGVGAGNAYQSGDVIITYCETTFRAMITGFATAAILGKPTRFYDGAMTEWHSLANVVASDGKAILPLDSPWRTDKSSLSMFRVASDPATITPRTVSDAYSNTAQQIIIEDYAYKGIVIDTGDSSSGTSTDSGTGATLPPNPCGG